MSMVQQVTALLALAIAQPQAATPPATAQSISACRTIGDDAARLRCFDQAAAAFEQALARKEVVVLTPDEVRNTRRSLFGFPLPKLSLFGGDEIADKEVTLPIRSVRSLGYGKWRLTLDGGAVWETTEGLEYGYVPPVGASVRIRRAALGSYMMNIAGEPGVKAKRVA